MKQLPRLVVLLLTALCLIGNAATPKVHTVAGAYVGDGKPATSAALSYPHYATIDNHGNLYIADNDHCRLRKVNVHGIISTIAGTGICGFSGDGGPARKAQINNPWGVVTDSHGNVFISGPHRVRMISASKIITTVAGNGTHGFCGDGGPATQACLWLPTELAVEENENGEVLYIADTLNHRIRRVDLFNGMITTVAGNGVPTYTGDGGLAINASLNQPWGVAIYPQTHSLWISDSQNYAIRRVDTVTGIIDTFFGGTCTFPLCFPNGISVDANGNLYAAYNAVVAEVAVPSGVATIKAGTGTGFGGDGGPATAALLNSPHDAIVDKTGNLFIVDLGNNRVRKVDTSGKISTIVGGYVGDGGKSIQSSLNGPNGLAFDNAKNLYIADTLNHRLRMVSPLGVISTIAGTGISGYTGDGGPASQAELNQPEAVAADGLGNLYVGDAGNSAIRKISATGIITTFASGIQVNAIAVDSSGNVYAGRSCTIVKFTPDGQSSIIAGVNQTCGYNGDGIPATQAEIVGSSGLAFDSSGNLYFSDTFNYRVRFVDQNGIIHTAAGNGHCSYSGDGGPAEMATLCWPQGIGFDLKGNLYIADVINLRIRVVSASGTISTYAGNGEDGYNGNGLPAQDTHVLPTAVAVSPSGVVYYSDDGSDMVRKIH